MRRITAALAAVPLAVAVAAGPGAAAPDTSAAEASAAPALSTGEIRGRYVRSDLVIVGALDRHRGNYHRLRFRQGPPTGRPGIPDDYDPPRVTLRSYFCPTGASISHVWTSKRCVLRSVRPASAPLAWVSIGGNNASVSGELVSKGWINVPLNIGLSWRVGQYPTSFTQDLHGEGWTARVTAKEGTFRGNLGNARVWEERQSSWVGRWRGSTR